MPAHKQVIRSHIDRQVLIPQQPETKVVNEVQHVPIQIQVPPR